MYVKLRAERFYRTTFVKISKHQIKEQGLTVEWAKRLADIKSRSIHKRVVKFLSFKSLKCTYCDRVGVYFYGMNLYTEDGTMMNFDHIIPRSRGGGNAKKNLQITCEPCNTKKGFLTHREFVAGKNPKDVEKNLNPPDKTVSWKTLFKDNFVG